MTNERLAQAIRRLDRALARVEAASARRAARPDPAFEQLQRRHEHLRARTKDAIGALDRLIGT
jgi:dsDNA-specific endonuclease/ATPase MutS2